MSALHPYTLQKYAFIAVIIIAVANAVFGFLYMYSLGVFNEGGGSYTASMRYLAPRAEPGRGCGVNTGLCFYDCGLNSLRVDQMLSLTNSYNTLWVYRFLIGAGLAAITWWLTIRGAVNQHA